MARSLRLLLFLMILFMQHLALAQDDTTQFIYKGFQGGANLQLDENARIHTNGLLQLTNTSKQVVGHAFHRFRLKFNSSSSGLRPDFSFSTNFVIAMVPELQNLSGHGIAFVISPSMDFSKAVASEYLGLLNLSNIGLSINHIFAVELDTVKTPVFNDINDNHVGIDVNSLISNVSAPVTYYANGKNESLQLINGDPIHVWIDYNDEEKFINVTLAPTNILKPSLPLLSTPIDLSLILLNNMYVGFTSSTGSFASDHYVLGWSFNKSGQSQNLEISELPQLPPQNKSTPPPPLSRPQTTKGLDVQYIIIIVVAVLCICLCLCLFVYFIVNRETLEDWEKEYGPQRFSYRDLYRATKGFKGEILGEGGFGKVYRGLLASSNKEIAVKRIERSSEQGLQEFVAEIVSVGRLQHRNLVQLFGYCRKNKKLLLVYDYMCNGSLDKFLYNNDRPTLPWCQRFHILRGVASAIFYLHEEWEQVVLHRDIKASNVMLDSGMNGRLGDFGLARTYNHGSNPQTTRVVGTLGYIAPELGRTGPTTSTDMFAFGIFMLEMVCGRKPIDYLALPEAIDLVNWVIEGLRKGAILDACDPRLAGHFVVEEMELVLKLGLLCSHTRPTLRPSASRVMQYLSGDAQLPEFEISTESASFRVFEPSDEITTELIMPFHTSFDRDSDHSLSSTDSILYVRH